MSTVDLNISHWLRISENVMVKDGQPLLSLDADVNSEAAYRRLQYNYPKFFKMDLLCKWAWLAAETLLSSAKGPVYDGIDKNKIALVLATAHGCIEVDKKYSETIDDIPSPALFVYTLPNIMLGEICIRHGFKGEQACFVNDTFNAGELYFWANDLLAARGMDACLCGWVDVTAGKCNICLYWLVKEGGGTACSAQAMQALYNS